MSPSKRLASASSSRYFPSRVQIGARTERAALEFLHANGCRLVARNVRFRVGEIDLVVRDGRELVFVEVRGRGEGSLETPEAALPFAKRMKLWRAIELYLLRQDAAERAGVAGIRVDFLATDGAKWTWFKNVELRSGG
ncbi:MAG: YraN family protein [Bdellovibrionales bacterium]|nr:YraN family protein [Bdellovibrionales bacterium]